MSDLLHNEFLLEKTIYLASVDTFSGLLSALSILDFDENVIILKSLCDPLVLTRVNVEKELVGRREKNRGVRKIKKQI